MKRKYLKGIAFALLVLVFAGVLSGCGTDDIDISGYASKTVVLKGLTDKDEVVSISDLKKMDCVTKKTESTSDKIGVVRATGPLLDTVLEKYGCSQSDFSKIILYGKDTYDIKLMKDFLEENDLILAFGIDGEPLDEESAPLRLIIPKSDSAYWIRMIRKIEFVK